MLGQRGSPPATAHVIKWVFSVSFIKASTFDETNNTLKCSGRMLFQSRGTKFVCKWQFCSGAVVCVWKSFNGFGLIFPGGTVWDREQQFWFMGNPWVNSMELSVKHLHARMLVSKESFEKERKARWFMFSLRFILTYFSLIVSVLIVLLRTVWQETSNLRNAL